MFGNDSTMGSIFGHQMSLLQLHTEMSRLVSLKNVRTRSIFLVRHTAIKSVFPSRLRFSIKPRREPTLLQLTPVDNQPQTRLVHYLKREREVLSHLVGF